MRGTRNRRSTGTYKGQLVSLGCQWTEKSSTLTCLQREPRVNPCFYAEYTHTVSAKQHSSPDTGSLCENPKWSDHLSDLWG